MAQYSKKVYAIDSYEENRYGETRRGSELTALTHFKFATNTSRPYYPTEYKFVKIIFPTEFDGIDKKRKVDIDTYVYVEKVVPRCSGTLPDGEKYIYGLEFWSGDHDNYFWFSYQPALYGTHIHAPEYTGRVANPTDGILYLVATAGINGRTLYKDHNHTVKQEFQFSSHTGSNPPYINVICEDVIPFASNRFPSRFIDKKAKCMFKWQFDYDKSNVTGILKQQSALLRYRNKGDANYTEVAIEGETNSYEVSANTFTGEEVEWQVVVTSDDNIQSTQSDWIVLTTTDSISDAQVLSPNGVFIDGAKDNTFLWQHIIDTGSPQSRYDLQYFSDNNWIDLISEATSRQYYTVPANTFPAGNIQWRVRTYNTDSVPGSWSIPANIAVRSAPEPPIISSIDNKARPTIKWQSTGQEAFKLELFKDGQLTFDTGEIATTEKSFQIPIYLEDGQYDLKLYVINTYVITSKPAIGTIIVDTVKPSQPYLSVAQIHNGVKLNISYSSDIVKAYIFRDGIPIKKASGNIYFDYNATGKHEYMVRGIDAYDNFNDSTIVAGTTIIRNATLAPTQKTSYILELKKSRDRIVAQNGRVSIVGDNHYFAGRKFPIFEFSEQSEENTELKYTFTDLSEFKRFKDLVNFRQTLLYRNKYGECMYCVISKFDWYNDKYGVNISFQMQKVDYTERISYDLEVGAS